MCELLNYNHCCNVLSCLYNFVCIYHIIVFSVLGDIVRAPIDGREALYAL